MLLAPAAAQAVSCDVALTDAEGTQWQTNVGGLLYTNNRNAIEEGDAYFDFGFNTYYGAPFDSCTYEDGDREVAYPLAGDPQSSTGLPRGVEFTRKVFVPDTEPAFARQLNVFRNVGSEPRTVDFYHFFEQNGLGTIDVLSTSSGDEEGTRADDWLVGARGAGTATADDRVTALVWQGSDTRRRDAVDDVYDYRSTVYDNDPSDDFSPFGDGDSTPQTAFREITLQPGETAIYLNAIALGLTQAEAEADARSLASSPEALAAGMSDDEVRAVRNFVLPDADRDGVGNTTDNCLNAGNADQANLDGDAPGDVCDADQDGDGLSDAAETAFGTNPRAADSDGDGKADRADGCPTRAGTNADGCPVETRTETRTETKTETVTVTRPGTITTETQVVRVPSFDRGAPRSMSATVRRSQRTYTTSGVIVPPEGVSAAQACGFGRVSVQVKSGTKTISTRRAEVRKDCTFTSKVTFKEKQRYAGKSKLKFTARFGGNQRLLPTRAAAVLIERPS